MIRLHHLEKSRSTRILWLLEAIGVEYEMIRYPRTGEHRAPEVLKHLHPLGKAPVLVDGDLVIAESSAILRYLDRHHGAGRFSPPPGSVEEARHDEWLDFVEGSLAPFVMIALIGMLTDGLAPAVDAIVMTETSTTLGHLDRAVAELPFLMGDRPMLADMQLSYTLELADDARLLGPYPAVAAYLIRLRTQPDYQAALAIGGPVSLGLR